MTNTVEAGAIERGSPFMRSEASTNVPAVNLSRCFDDMLRRSVGGQSAIEDRSREASLAVGTGCLATGARPFQFRRGFAQSRSLSATDTILCVSALTA